MMQRYKLSTASFHHIYQLPAARRKRKSKIQNICGNKMLPISFAVLHTSRCQIDILVYFTLYIAGTGLISHVR